MIHRIAAVCVGLLALEACSGGSEAPAEPNPRVDSVSISPSTAALSPGQAFQFQAQVSGVGSFSQSVVWSVDTDGPQYSPGSVSANGTYHAPDLSPNAPIRVHARSVADLSKEAVAVVTLPARSFTILPSSAQVAPGETVQFQAVVTGAVNSSVQWIAFQGTIDGAGLYRAPAFWTPDSVIAFSVLGSVQTPIEVLRPAPVLAAISGAGTVGDHITLTGTDLLHAVVVFPATQGPPIRVTGFTADTLLDVVVPLGAASGPIHVETIGFPHQGTLVSNSVDFVRKPRVLLHPQRPDVAQGDSVPLDVAWLGASGPEPLTFDADLGSVAHQVYSAPPSVAATSFAHVRACVTGTTNCSEVTIAVQPLTVEPTPAIVAAGGSLDFVARSGGAAVNATFAVKSGLGTVTALGRYVSPRTLQEAGEEVLIANGSGAQTEVQVAVTGLVPGQLNRLVDHIDHHRIDPNTMGPRGASVDAVAVSGARAYVLRRALTGTDQFGTSFEATAYVWIDVYDLADPLRPVWVGAVECPTRATMLVAIAGRLYAWSATESQLAAYDLTGTLPVLVARDTDARSDSPPVVDGNRLLLFAHPHFENSLELRSYDFTQSALPVPERTALPLPNDALDNTGHAYLSRVTATADHVYARYVRHVVTPPGEVAIATWDLTVHPPELMGAVTTDWTTPFPDDLSIIGSLLADSTTHGADLYDLGAGLPVKIGQLPYNPMRVFARQGTRNVTGTAGSLYVLDTVERTTPRFTATLEPNLHTSGAAWVGNLVYAAQGLAGLGIYDAAPSGGPVARGLRLTVPDTTLEYGIAAAISGRYLYTTGGRVLFDIESDIFAVWDLASSPPAPVWARLAPNLHGVNMAGVAIAIAGDKLIRGTLFELEVWSLADPTLPLQLSSVLVDVTCLAMDGNVAWVGTEEGDLVAYDITSPSGPIELSRTFLGAFPAGMATFGAGRLAVALLASATGDVAFVDISNPSAPGVVSTAGLGIPTYSVAFAGSIALAATDSGLATIDASDPAHPVRLAMRPVPGSDRYAGMYLQPIAVTVASHDGIAWVAAETAFGAGPIYGFDLRNPAVPRLVSQGSTGTLEFGGEVFGFVFDGTRGFSVGIFPNGGLLELDLSQPRNVIVLTEAQRVLQN